jgi:GNAT superfamily N-acetyltransferase
MPALQVVKLSLKEQDRVLALVQKLLRELESGSDEFAGIDKQKMLRDLAENEERFNAFAAINERGEHVGVLTLVEAFAIYAGGNYGVIDEMYVSPEYRSQGVGKMLLAAAKEFGRAKGWLRIDVTAPPEEEWRRTVKFYEREGFVFTGPKLRCKL